MSVVGFDIGYQSCYVAIARHGGVEVITNDYSERNSASMVGFTPKQRYMSTSAKTKSMTNVKNTVMGFKNLVGRAYSDPVVQREMKSQHYKMIQLNNDKLGIQVDYLDNQTTFSAEQVMAMMLTYLKGIAENSLGKPVKDCVISVGLALFISYMTLVTPPLLNIHVLI
jgi:molecular chaperone DnaK (HSP70)